MLSVLFLQIRKNVHDYRNKIAVKVSCLVWILTHLFIASSLFPKILIKFVIDTFHGKLWTRSCNFLYVQTLYTHCGPVLPVMARECSRGEERDQTLWLQQVVWNNVCVFKLCQCLYSQEEDGNVRLNLILNLREVSNFMTTTLYCSVI